MGYLASTKILAARSTPSPTEAGFPYQATWPIIDFVVQKPSFAKHAGSLGLGDRMTFHGQVDVIADAAAERACGVFDDL